MDSQTRKKIWGWFFFDWASQPYNTLLLTFVFAPYVKELIGDGTQAQAAWGFGVAAAGLIMAGLAPILGALADSTGTRMRWIWVFSLMYVLGSSGLWFAAPDDFNLPLTLMFFAVGLIGMEFATIFTNSMLPDLGTPEEVGRISGDGWAFGYLGGLAALVVMILFFAEGSETGRTIAGFAPAFGLDPETRQGTRFVGPFTAFWYVLFMVPFFLYVGEAHTRKPQPGAVKKALVQVGGTIRSLPRRPNLFAFLAGSMLYRDALNGMFTFGGIYAAGILDWSVLDTGLFGILAIIASAASAWIAGHLVQAHGPKPVISVSILVLVLVALGLIFVSREAVLGVPIEAGSRLPDLLFFCFGALIGAAGGALLSSSRTMMVLQSEHDHMTEGFGLYALSGKATSFLTPLMIGVFTTTTGSQQLGITPILVLLICGFFLLQRVEAKRPHKRT